MNFIAHLAILFALFTPLSYAFEVAGIDITKTLSTIGTCTTNCLAKTPGWKPINSVSDLTSYCQSNGDTPPSDLIVCAAGCDGGKDSAAVGTIYGVCQAAKAGLVDALASASITNIGSIQGIYRHYV
jgi:hypothetical protein